MWMKASKTNGRAAAGMAGMVLLVDDEVACWQRWATTCAGAYRRLKPTIRLTPARSAWPTSAADVAYESVSGLSTKVGMPASSRAPTIAGWATVEACTKAASMPSDSACSTLVDDRLRPVALGQVGEHLAVAGDQVQLDVAAPWPGPAGRPCGRCRPGR